MSEPPRSTKTLTPKSERENRPRTGYVRSSANHIGVEWHFEVLSEDIKVGIVTILTGDGPIHIGLNRAEATKLAHTLQLFLQDWPKDHTAS